MPVAEAVATGAFSIPRNDDWAFARVAFDLHRTGDVHLVGWGEMTMVGQLVWALPFLAVLGNTMVAVHVAAVVLAAVGLGCTYLVLRHWLRPAAAVLGTASVAAFPPFALTVPTFMTDVPSYALQAACLALGLPALRGERPRRGLLAASVLVGFAGFTMRDTALVAPVAVLAGAAWASRRRTRADLVLCAGLAAALLTASAAFFAWRHGLPNDQPSRAGFAPSLGLENAKAFLTLGLALLPAALALLAARGRPPLRAAGLAAGAFVLGVALFVVARGDSVITGNYLDPLGALGNGVLTCCRVSPLAGGIWPALSVATVIAAVALAALVGSAAWDGARRLLAERRAPAPHDVALGVFGALAAVSVVGRGLMGLPAFDRYLLPLLLAALVPALRAVSGPVGRRWAPALTGLAALVALTVVLGADLSAYDAARWRAGERLVRSGIPPRQVDAGFEWLGAHSPGVVPDRARGPWAPPLGPNAETFPSAGNCGLVASSPRPEPGLELVERRRFRGLGPLADGAVWAYRNPAACRLTAQRAG